MSILLKLNKYIVCNLLRFLAILICFPAVEICAADNPAAIRSCLEDEGVKNAMLALVASTVDSGKPPASPEWQAFTIELAARNFVSQLRRCKAYYGSVPFNEEEPQIEALLQRAILMANVLAPHSKSQRPTHANRIKGFCERAGIQISSTPDITVTDAPIKRP